MNTIPVVATLLSPVSISSRHKVAGDVPGTLHFLPGSAIRGALATNFIRAGGSEESDEFKRLFLSDEVRFGNLYPGRDGKPIPLTAWTCKAKPGFDSDGGHGVWDLLLALAAKRLFNREIVGPACQGHGNRRKVDLERFAGFYGYDSDRKKWKKSGPDARIVARTSVCSPLGTAKYGQLYSLEALEEGQLFRGFIGCCKGDLSALQNYLIQVNEPHGQARKELFLGTARNRGLGKVKVELLDGRQDINLYGRGKDDQRKRFCNFNKVLRSLAGNGRDGKSYFSLTLDSDVIIQDDLLRYMSYLDPKVIREDLLSRTGHDHAWLENTELILHVSATRRLSGWNERHGLPKDEALAISMGSVFLYRYDGNDDDTLLNGLQELEREGLGQRRKEGFGYVCACDPFHVQFYGGEMP